MKNKICLPLIAAVVVAGLPSTSFARWTPAPCAQISTDAFIKNRQGQVQTPTEDTTFGIGCYAASGELVRRVMHFSVANPQHWTITEEPLGLSGKFEAYMETSLGKTVFVASAVGLGLLGARAMRSVEARIDAKFPRRDPVAPLAPENGAPAADVPAPGVSVPSVRGPRPVAIRMLDPKDLNINHIAEHIQVSKLVLSADVIPAGLRWRTYRDGSRWIIQRKRLPSGSLIHLDTAYEAIRIDTTTSGVRTAAEGEWATTPWTVELYEVLADPIELQATYRPEPVVDVPPATFELSGEGNEPAPVVEPEAPVFPSAPPVESGAAE